MKLRQFTAEEEEMFRKNRKLIYYVVNRYKNQNEADYDEYEQLGRIALAKAVQTFNAAKGNKFATYATSIIHNEIRMAIRASKKHQRNISMETVISNSGGKSDMTLQDVIPEKNGTPLEEQEEYRVQLERSLSIILNKLSFREKIAMILSISGATQVEIAERFSISRSYASRIISRARKKVNSYMLKQLEFDQNIVKVTVRNGIIIIIFQPSNVENIEEMVESFLLVNANARETPGFTITTSNRQIVIELQCDNELFPLVAEFLFFMEKHLSSESEKDDQNI